MKLYLGLMILIVILLMGCVGKVQWVQRPGGTPEAMHWIPTCPYCQHVVNYDTLQCQNPDCRVLLTWSDKELYATELYQPALAAAQPIKSDAELSAPPSPQIIRPVSPRPEQPISSQPATEQQASQAHSTTPSQPDGPIQAPATTQPVTASTQTSPEVKPDQPAEPDQPSTTEEPTKPASDEETWEIKPEEW